MQRADFTRMTRMTMIRYLALSRRSFGVNLKNKETNIIYKQVIKKELG
jgi:hypothetical protein